MASDNSLIISINGDAKDFLDEIDKIKKQTQDLEKTLTAVAKGSAIAFAAFAGSIAVATKAFSKYETALVGVGKTTNIEGKRLAKFGKEFQKLSSEIPVSTNELLAIAQAAGQLGVSGEENLLKFTETVAKLGVATDLSGDQAATALARILNVTGESIETIDKLGSVIVSLGNNFAASESEIVKVAQEVSKSSAVFGVSAAEATALAAAMKSLGIQAQLGGSSVGKTFLKMQKAINDGGASFQNLSTITGIAGDQLKQTFETDAAGVFQKFIEGLGSLEGGTAEIFKALESFGLKGDEINKVLPVLAKNSALVGSSFKLAAAEVANATALNDEAAKAFDTLASKAKITSNNFDTFITKIGAELAPEVESLLDSLNSLLKTINETDNGTIKIIASFLKWGAIISGVVLSVSTALLSFFKLRTAYLAVRSAISTSGAALAKWGTRIAGIAVSGTELLAFLTRLGGKFLGIISLLELSGDTIKDTFDPEKTDIDELTKRLSSLESQLQDINALDITPTPEQAAYKKDLEEQIDLLKKLKAGKESAASVDPDFGTGSLLIRPEVTEAPESLDFSVTATPEGEGAGVKLTNDQLVEQQKQEAQVKASEVKKQGLIDEADAKRIEKLKQTNEELKAIQIARREGDTEEEKAQLQRKAEIENEFVEARKIKNDEERALTLDNLRLKHEAELLAIQEHEALKDEEDLIRKEERALLDEELTEQEKERLNARTEEEQAALASKFDTAIQAQQKFDDNKIKEQAAIQNKFLQDEKKFGTQIATLKQFFASAEVVGAKNAANQLVQLTNSKNSTLKGIGKAAARTQAAIKTAEGAISAYASLSGIPIVGPVLGGLAAAAIIAYGVEQQQKISAAATGGFIPPGGAGARDRVPAMLEPGELVVPTALAPNFIQSVGQPQSGDFGNEDVTAPEGGGGETTLRLEGDLVQNEEFVSALATQIKELREFDNVEI